LNILTPIGVNTTGFSKLLSYQLCVQIVCPQMEYKLAINLFSHSQLKIHIQNKCMRLI
ncbi:hypothetical protein BCV71DRAFT_188041, partial [Rhizopus microsporus]